MEKRQVAVEGPISIYGLTVAPVTETVMGCWQHKKVSAIFGLKKPLYVLVATDRYRIKAFDMDGTETTVETIIEKYPELQTALSQFSRE